jgi:hypothetical protein
MADPEMTTAAATLTLWSTVRANSSTAANLFFNFLIAKSHFFYSD